MPRTPPCRVRPLRRAPYSRYKIGGLGLQPLVLHKPCPCQEWKISPKSKFWVWSPLAIYRRLSDPPRGRMPGRLFSDFFRVSGPEGPRDPVNGQRVPKFWGRMSGGRPRGYPGGRPGAKTWVKPSKSWKNKHFGADAHDPKARTSMTPGGFK